MAIHSSGTTSSAGRSGSDRATDFNCHNRTASTDISAIIGSSRPLVFSCRSSTRHPVFSGLVPFLNIECKGISVVDCESYKTSRCESRP